MAWWNPMTWGQAGRDKQVLNELLALLDSEEKEAKQCRLLLIAYANETDPEKKIQAFTKFERELRKFEEAESIIKALDEKVLARSAFKKLAA